MCVVGGRGGGGSVKTTKREQTGDRNQSVNTVFNVCSQQAERKHRREGGVGEGGRERGEGRWRGR